MYIQLSAAMYYALLNPDMDFIFKERGQFNVKASFPTVRFSRTSRFIVTVTSHAHNLASDARCNHILHRAS